jgi:lipopolysaccharide export system protein LptA
MRRALVLFLTLSVFSPALSLGAETRRTTVPTTIQAERMRYDSDGQKVVFDGNVHVKRPDFDLWAAQLTVFLDRTKSGSKSANATGGMGGMGMDAGSVNRIVAEKNVRIQQDHKVGTCGKATYTVSDGKVVMEQQPLLVDGSNTIEGRIINFYTRDSRSEVIDGVRATFVTPGNTPKTEFDRPFGEKTAPEAGKEADAP